MFQDFLHLQGRLEVVMGMESGVASTHTSANGLDSDAQNGRTDETVIVMEEDPSGEAQILPQGANAKSCLLLALTQPKPYEPKPKLNLLDFV